MSKVKKLSVGGREFYVQKMNAFDGLKVFGDLQKEILPALGGAFSGVQSDNQQPSGDSIGEAISTLSQTLSGDSLAQWSKRLLCDGSVSFDAPSGEAVPLRESDFDEVFEDFTGVLELLVAVIMENFKAPLAGLLSRTGLGNWNTDKLSALTGKTS